MLYSDDPSSFEVWFAAWRDLGRFELVPVRTSAETARHIADRL